MRKPRKPTRAELMARIIVGAITAGVVLRLGKATVGPYHTAVPGRSTAALLSYGSGVDEFGTPAEVAAATVERFGVTRCIDAVKLAARKGGRTYSNLSTPVWP